MAFHIDFHCCCLIYFKDKDSTDESDEPNLVCVDIVLLSLLLYSLSQSRHSSQKEQAEKCTLIAGQNVTTM